MSIIDKRILDIVSAFKPGRRFTAQTVLESMIESKFKFTPNRNKITTTLKLSPLVSFDDNDRSPITFVRTEVTAC